MPSLPCLMFVCSRRYGDGEGNKDFLASGIARMVRAVKVNQQTSSTIVIVIAIQTKAAASGRATRAIYAHLIVESQLPLTKSHQTMLQSQDLESVSDWKTIVSELYASELQSFEVLT